MFKEGDYIRLKYMVVEIEQYFPDTNCFSVNSEEVDMRAGTLGYPNAWDNAIYISANHVMWSIKKEFTYDVEDYGINGSMSCVSTNLRYDTRRRLEDNNHYTYINKVDFTKNVEMDDILYVVNLDTDFSKNGVYYLIPSTYDYENMYSPYAEDSLFSIDDIKKGLVSNKKYIREKSTKKKIQNSIGSNFIGVTYPGEAFWGKIIEITPVLDTSWNLIVEMSDGVIWHIHSSHVETYNPNVQGIEIFHASNNRKILNDNPKSREEIEKEIDNLPFRTGGWEYD